MDHLLHRRIHHSDVCWLHRTTEEDKVAITHYSVHHADGDTVYVCRGVTSEHLMAVTVQTTRMGDMGVAPRIVWHSRIEDADAIGLDFEENMVEDCAFLGDDCYEERIHPFAVRFLDDVDWEDRRMVFAAMDRLVARVRAMLRGEEE